MRASRPGEAQEEAQKEGQKEAPRKAPEGPPGSARSKARVTALWATLLFTLASTRAFAAEPTDFFDLSLEELAAVEVTSVAGVATEIFYTPAAIYTMGQEELRRSGHAHIADALRLVPGAYVGRVDSNQWAVGVRGFGDLFSTICKCWWTAA